MSKTFEECENTLSEEYLLELGSWLDMNKEIWLFHSFNEPEDAKAICSTWDSKNIYGYNILKCSDVESLSNLMDCDNVDRLFHLINTLKVNYKDESVTAFYKCKEPKKLNLQIILPSGDENQLDISNEGSINIGGFEISPYGIQAIPESFSYGTNTPALSRNNSFEVPFDEDIPRNTKDAIIYLHQIGRGSSSQVMKALYVPTLTMVAVKIVRVGSPSIRKQMLSELKALYSISKYSLRPQIPQIKKARIEAMSNEALSFFGTTTNKKSTENSQWQELKTVLSKYSDLIFIIFTSSILISLIYVITHWQNIHALEFLTLFMGVAAVGFCEYAISNDEDFMSRVNEDELVYTNNENILDAINQNFAMNIAGNLNEESSDKFSLIDKLCPYIVKFYDAYTEPDQSAVCIVLELMDGGSLQNIIDNKLKLNEHDLAIVAYSITRALSELHKRNIVHRDIKPGNILYDHHGFVKLSDFGIVREMSDQLVGTNTFTGTVHYMSPERINGEIYSYKSDIWSLGITMLTLTQGSTPFSQTEGYWGVLDGISRNLTNNLTLKISEELNDFICLCLKQNPQERPPAEILLNHPFIKDFESSQPKLSCCYTDPMKFSSVKEIMDKVLDWHVNTIVTSDCVDTIVEILLAKVESENQDYNANNCNNQEDMQRLYRFWFPHFCCIRKLNWLAIQYGCESYQLIAYVKLRLATVNSVLLSIISMLQADKLHNKRRDEAMTGYNDAMDLISSAEERQEISGIAAKELFLIISAVKSKMSIIRSKGFNKPTVSFKISSGSKSTKSASAPYSTKELTASSSFAENTPTTSGNTDHPKSKFINYSLKSSEDASVHTKTLTPFSSKTQSPETPNDDCKFPFLAYSLQHQYDDNAYDPFIHEHDTELLVSQNECRVNVSNIDNSTRCNKRATMPVHRVKRRISLVECEDM